MSLYCSSCKFSVRKSKLYILLNHEKTLLCHRKQFVDGMNSEVEQIIAKEKVGQKPMFAQFLLLHCSNEAVRSSSTTPLTLFWHCMHMRFRAAGLLYPGPLFRKQPVQMNFSDWHC